MANGQQGNQQQGGQQQGRQQRNVSLSELEIVSGPDRTTRTVTVRTVVQFGDRPFTGQVQFTLDDQHYNFVPADTATGEAVCMITLPDDNEHRLRAHVVNHPGKSTRHLRVRVPPAGAAPAFKPPIFAIAYYDDDDNGNYIAVAYGDREGIPATGTPVEFLANGVHVIERIDTEGYARHPYQVALGAPPLEVRVNIPKADEPENATFQFERRDLPFLRLGGRMLFAALLFVIFNLWTFGTGIEPVVQPKNNPALSEVERRYFGKTSTAQPPAIVKKEWAPIVGIYTIKDLAWGANFWLFIAGLLTFISSFTVNIPYFVRKTIAAATNRAEKSRAVIRKEIRQATTDQERASLKEAFKQAGMTSLAQHLINFGREVLAVALFHR